ncbi:MAG TPA: nucleotidyltransferase family protein [Bacteroidia bacterium]|nr:nucleotidyltransferase family protein [Bacteroidia bacterium]
MNRNQIIEAIVNYLKQNQVKEIGLFGSFARNEMKESSDIDVLVEYKRGTTLLDIVRMKQELNNIIGRKVDLVSKNAVRSSVMNYIKNDLQVVYHD